MEARHEALALPACREHEPEQGRRDEAGDTGHRVVDPRGRAHVGLVDGAHHGRGQRCHAEGEAEREHGQRRQHHACVAKVAAAQPQQQREAGGDDARADGEQQARRAALGQAASGARAEAHRQRQWQEGSASLRGRVAAGSDQGVGQQHHQATKGRVKEERQQGDADEAPSAEEGERHHRPLAEVPLQPHEAGQQDHAEDEGARGRSRVAGAGRCRGWHAAMSGQQREADGEQGQAAGGEQRACPVERRGVFAPAFLDASNCEHGGDCGHRQVDEEDRAPARGIDEPAAGQRAERAGDGAGRGPGADGPAARLAAEGRPEQGQAGRHQEGRAQALQHAGREQGREAGGEGAGQRGGRKHRHAGEEGALPAPAVAGDAAEEDEGAERQQVGVDEPGDRSAAGAEVMLDGWQADVDHRAVDEGQARAEDGRGQGPGRVSGAAGRGSRLGAASRPARARRRRRRRRPGSGCAPSTRRCRRRRRRGSAS